LHRGARGGVLIDDPKQLFRIRPAMEAPAHEQPSLVLLVRSASEVDVLEIASLLKLSTAAARGPRTSDNASVAHSLSGHVENAADEYRC
jgi:hypothetical protein